MPTIKLQTNDNEIFETDINVAKLSGTIKTVLEDCGVEDDGDVVIPLPNISAPIMQRFLVWAEHHKDDPEPVKDDERNLYISEWDAEYLKMDQAILFELILAANYLDAKGLMEMLCKTVADMIKGRSVEDIRQTFNIGNDFTPAEEETARRESEWCEDPPEKPYEDMI